MFNMVQTLAYSLNALHFNNKNHRIVKHREDPISEKLLIYLLGSILTYFYYISWTRDYVVH